MSRRTETPIAAARRLTRFVQNEGFGIKALYAYNAEDGSPFYWRIRLESQNDKKRIFPMRCIDGKYELKEPAFGSTGKPLYGLEQLRKARAPVWVVEGEKCVEEMKEHGFVAVSASNGAEGMTKADWTPLKGRKCILWPDNDEPGKKAMDRAAQTLRGIGCDIDIVDVSVLKLEPGDDCVDYFKSHRRKGKRALDQLPLVHLDDTAPEANIPFDKLQKMLTTDPGALFEKPVMKALQQLFVDDRPAHARLRDTVRHARLVKVADFDAVSEAAGTTDAPADMFDEVIPSKEAVVGADLLDRIFETIKSFVIAEASTLHIATLWIAHTWLIGAFNVSPIAHITAPEKRCGKSKLLAVIEKLSYRPLSASHITAAALFRAVDAYQPTLLIDEVDSFLKNYPEIRGLLNSGYNRGGKTMRCTGDEHNLQLFSTFGPKVLCGIGELWDTVADRSVRLPLRRKMPTETSENIYRTPPEVWATLRSQLARFAKDVFSDVSELSIPVVKGLNDRANDSYGPLLTIAEIAGGHWPKRIRDAALGQDAKDVSNVGINEELLSDIRQILCTHNDPKSIASDALLLKLTSNAELRWSTLYKGKSLDKHGLARRLKSFGVFPENIRETGGGNRRGYFIKDFNDAFARYLAPLELPVTPLQVPTNEIGNKSKHGRNTVTRKLPHASRPRASMAIASRGDKAVDRRKRPRPMKGP